MPTRGDPRALEFDGDERKLERFWEDIEVLLERANVTDPKLMMAWAVRYTTQAVGKL